MQNPAAFEVGRGLGQAVAGAKLAVDGATIARGGLGVAVKTGATVVGAFAGAAVAMAGAVVAAGGAANVYTGGLHIGNAFAEKPDSSKDASVNLPTRDVTGKVHGPLPSRSEVSKVPVEDLKQFQGELKASVQERIKTTARLGPDPQHGQRQAAEQRLIQAIEQKLKQQ